MVGLKASRATLESFCLVWLPALTAPLSFTLLRYCSVFATKIKIILTILKWFLLLVFVENIKNVHFLADQLSHVHNSFNASFARALHRVRQNTAMAQRATIWWYEGTPPFLFFFLHYWVFVRTEINMFVNVS